MANKGLNPSGPILDSEFKLGTSTFKVLRVANEIEAKINVSDVDLLKVGHYG